MNSIEQNLQGIRNRMQLACAHAQRNVADVKLLLATKTVDPERIIMALNAGENLLGENKVQELKEKYEALQPWPHQTHFIGHLQSNKVKEVLKFADCIQSLDRISLAEKLQKRLEFENKTIDVMIQVNTSYEESKFGISPEKALDFAKNVQEMDRIRIIGLMTIGLFSAEIEKVRKCFRLLKEIQIQFFAAGIPAQELSMGMSGDLETAIEEGSTMIRVGTAIFGKRPYPDSYYWNEKK
ncbi:MAG: YggS family pyridoxal phosphate-dependent enzyme [Flavobacteriaceae bacterium]|nr:YggS family pyridoxal phosphate-dependent enzyme [Flavobacteriaceae bacterium]